jgi:hypothetical protein
VVEYRLPGRQSLTFLQQEDTAFALLKQLGIAPEAGHSKFPAFDYVFALASIAAVEPLIQIPVGVQSPIAIRRKWKSPSHGNRRSHSKKDSAVCLKAAQERVSRLGRSA